MALIVAAAMGVQSLIGEGKDRKPLSNIEPSNLAAQGSFVPLVIGRRRVGCVLAWAGSRYARNEGQTSGGGFGKGAKKKATGGTTIFYEAGWHQICVGPAKRLRRIWQDGKIVWEGDINSTDDPSGSTFAALDGSGFAIYWGEPDQPVNAILADASRVGIASRWPHLCYAVWTDKRLGPQPRWPQIDYDIECAVYRETMDAAYPGLFTAVDPYITNMDYEGNNAGYALGQVLFESYPHGLGLPHGDFSIFDGASDPCSEDTVTVTGDDGDLLLNDANTQGLSTNGVGAETIIFDQVLDDVVDAGWYRIDGLGTYTDLIDTWRNGGVASSGDSEFVHALVELTDGVTTITLLDADIPTNFTVGPGDPAEEIDCWFGIYSGAIHAHRHGSRRYVELTPGTWTLHYEIEVDRGAGAGAGHFVVDSDVNLQEIENPVETPAGGGSFYDLVTKMDEEEIVSSVLADDGAEATRIISECLEDMGAMMHRDYARSGLNAWTSVREATPIALPSDLVLPTDVDAEFSFEEKPVDREMFSFSDVSRQFKETIIAIDEDGQPAEVNNIRADKVDLPTVVDFLVGGKVAERRSQEKLAGSAKFTVFAGRDTRKLSPGTVFTVSDIHYALRLTEVKASPDNDRVEISAVPDYYGVEATTKVPVQVSSPVGDTSAPANNVRQTFFEVPGLIGEPGLMQVVPLRVRANQRMTFQVVYLSPSGVTYFESIRDTHIQTGGLLTSAMVGTGPWQIENGPTFNAEGEDIADVVEDYTADEISWRLGRQMCLIGEELFYLRNVTALGGSSYRLDGLIRARGDTEHAAHAINDPVFIFQMDGCEPFYDGLLSPGATLYMKQQAVGINGAVAMGDVVAVTKTLVGKGVVPMKPGPIRVTAPTLCVNEFATGEDITIEWTYRSTAVPNCGAGMMPNGAAYGTSPVQGTFELQFFTTGDVLEQTVDNGTATDYDITNANLVTWFGGEPAAFKVRVYNINGGFRSGYVERLITRV